MLPWSVRLLLLLVVALTLLLGIEIAATLAEPRFGVPAWAWLPATLGTLGWIGWYVVRRMPLAWGGIAGGLLAVVAAWLTFPIKLRLSGGPLAWPDEVDIPLVATALVVMFLAGTVMGLAGGAVARRRRRIRRRQAALEVIDSPMAGVIDPAHVRSDETDALPRRRVRR
ncbi:MAG: hypothetical protein MUF40_01125 [Gemmatimonadaceae bacterium]|jgi:hypothetical protein|nr:hypothetical protein [Gemmatimonadaceae bacterium]